MPECELSEAEGEATLPREAGRTSPQALCAQPPACVLKNGRWQTSVDVGDRVARDYCFERKRTSRERFIFLAALLTLRVEFNAGGDGGAGIFIVARRVCFGKSGQAVHGVAVASSRSSRVQGVP